jgi:hypothetical protein
MLKFSVRTLMAFALAASIGFANLTPAFAQDNDTSIGIHPGTDYASIPSLQVGSFRLWDTGTAWVDIEPQKGQYNWAALDAWVANSKKAGVTDLIYVFGTTPSWAVNPAYAKKKETKGPGFRGKGSTKPPVMSEFEAFATQVVTRYAGSITSYEVWNEANLLSYWSGTPAQMAQMTKILHSVVQGVDSSATVVAASTTMRGGKYKSFYIPYLKQLKSMGWPVEAFSVHLYPKTKGTPADRVKLINKYKADLRKVGAPAYEIWDTESNYGLRGYRIPSSKVAAYVGQTFLDSKRLGISRTYWYTWAPEIKYKGKPVLGIITYTGTNGTVALNEISSWISGTNASACKTSKKLVTCRFDSSSVAQQIAWTTSGVSYLSVPQFATRACTLTQGCVSVSPGSRIKVGITPVKFD